MQRAEALPTQGLLRCSVYELLVGLLLLWAFAGCRMIPDVAAPPEFGLAPEVIRDDTRTLIPPIDSVLLARARAETEAAEVVLLESGDDALLARIHLIRAARETIDIQTFIWVHDRVGSWIFRELVAAAQRGVRVRLLIDQFVPPEIPTGAYAGLATVHQNLEIRLFRPLSSDAINTEWALTRNAFTRFMTMNQRMHNKVVLVDGVAAIVGGRNVQDAYYDRHPRFNFRDRDVIVSGPVCPRIGEFFELFWTDQESIEATRLNDLRRALESGQAYLPEVLSDRVHEVFAALDRQANEPDLAAGRPALQSWAVDDIQFLSDLPKDSRKVRPRWSRNPFGPLVERVMKTKEEVLLETPYPILGDRSRKLWRKILQRQPDARLRVSTNSLASGDHLVVGGIALGQRQEQIEDLRVELHLARPLPGDIRTMVPRYDALRLESGGALIPDREADPVLPPWEGDGPRFCVHGKSLVIDRRVSFVGSHNFDPRSFDLNTECGVLIDDPAFARHLAEKLELAMHPRNSWIVAERQLPPGVSELNGLLNRISAALPTFDLWPLEHVSCFELKENAEPCSPFNPEFHDRYRDVGPTPGLDLGTDEIQARLVRSFARLSAPLM